MVMRPKILVAFVALATLSGCATDELCSETSRCFSSGVCKPSSGLWCTVGSDADCKASTNCKERGDCTKVGEKCVVASDADCAQTEDCLKHGRCGRVVETFDGDPEPARCRPTKDKHCKDSKSCKVDGGCSLVAQNNFGLNPTFTCGIKTSADCQNSQNCKVAGQCIAAPSPENTSSDACEGHSLQCVASCASVGQCEQNDNGLMCGDEDQPKMCIWQCKARCGGSSKTCVRLFD